MALIIASSLKQAYPSPPLEDINDIVIADSVQVFNGYEWFWVLVTEVHGDTLIGKVDNPILGNYGYKMDDTIEFHKSNVFEVYEESKTLMRIYEQYGRDAFSILPTEMSMKLRCMFMKRKRPM